MATVASANGQQEWNCYGPSWNRRNEAAKACFAKASDPADHLLRPQPAWSGSSFHGNAEPLYLFVFAQFRTENRFTLFLELL
ncbi:hypothetical protein EOC94_21705 [Mesorhizobium sp. M6A.T.Ce.TU.016.01.1.1]|nr:hypothetical protein EOC94_21705 [Mesorhizobium sp. M6A.T.Ce.TU.016.01.1.1]